MKPLIIFLALLLVTGCTGPIKNRPVSAPTDVYIETTTAPDKTENATNALTLEGSYRCWQFNVDGYGGSCRTLSPMVLASDGTYTISSTTGTYKIIGDAITLSESNYWGPGTIKEDGLQIYFNYLYNEKRYEVTYLQE